jgi:hypothetical protein
MSEHVCASEIVDSYDLQVPTALSDDSSDAAPNSSEAIDSDFRGHSFDSLSAATRFECTVSEGAT